MNQDGYYFFKKRKRFSDDFGREVFRWVLGITISIFLAFIWVFFFGVSTHASGDSMAPMVVDNEKVLINRAVYKFVLPSPGDVVVFLPNGNNNVEYYIKRVVARPGDKVRIEDGILYVNGIVSEYVDSKLTDPGIASEEITIEQGTYFVLSDDPLYVNDSRNANIGPVKSKDILGKVWFAFSEGNTRSHFVK